MRYKIKYLADSYDTNPKCHDSQEPVKPGDVIYLEGDFFYYVSAIEKAAQGDRLVLSKSATSEEEARLLATQYGHLTES